MATTEPWPGYWEQFHSFVETDVRQAAFDGKLPIWGRKVGNWVIEQTQRPVREQIPRDFWKHNWIEVLDFLHHDPEKFTTAADPLYTEKVKWRDLWTNRDAVERAWPAVNQGPLRLELGEAGEFFETKRAHSLYTHTRILKVRISNSDPHKSLFECKIHVTDITPHEYDGPWLLKEGFSLAAGDHEFVPLASYQEPDNIKISPYGDTFMEILVTKNRPKPSSSMQHVLTIRATALDSPFCEIKCKLWVDDDGRLKIDVVQ